MSILTDRGILLVSSIKLLNDYYQIRKQVEVERIDLPDQEKQFFIEIRNNDRENTIIQFIVTILKFWYLNDQELIFVVIRMDDIRGTQ